MALSAVHADPGFDHPDVPSQLLQPQHDLVASDRNADSPWVVADSRRRLMKVMPTKAERITLSALDRVFDRYNRLGAIEIKVVDLEPALVGVHERAVRLLTRPALALVNPRELQAIAAHELAHEYFWKEFEVALNANAFERLQELELICDGVAVITLTSLGIDRRHLINAAAKLTRYNERTAARIMTSRQVSLERRIAFIKEVDRLLGGKTRRYGNGRIGIPAGR